MLTAPPLVALSRPPRLRPGDRVALIAPSGPVPRERLDAGCAVLRSWGLEVVPTPHLGDVHDELNYLAGTDADRAADLQQAWLDPSVAAVLCVRGGYGGQRMTDLLDWEAMRGAAPKVFAGYSDITALHEAFATQLGVVTLHAPMPATASFADERAVEMLRAVLFEPASVLTLTSPSAETLVPGVAHGVTVGGCLSLLAAEVGSPTARPGARGGIVVLEDLEEERYRLDRMFTQLLRAGVVRRRRRDRARLMGGLRGRRPRAGAGPARRPRRTHGVGARVRSLPGPADGAARRTRHPRRQRRDPRARPPGSRVT